MARIMSKGVLRLGPQQTLRFAMRGTGNRHSSNHATIPKRHAHLVSDLDYSLNTTKPPIHRLHSLVIDVITHEDSECLPGLWEEDCIRGAKHDFYSMDYK
jgi:hypothetical protein